jgi:hypothetical protein
VPRDCEFSYGESIQAANFLSARNSGVLHCDEGHRTWLLERTVDGWREPIRNELWASLPEIAASS